MTTTYVKEKSTGNILTSTSGQDPNNPIHIEAMNNFITSRGWSLDDYEVGIVDDMVAQGWLDEQAELAKTYVDHRASSYPSIPDQLDYIYHNGLEKWKTDMVLPVKEKYPKGAN